MDLRGGPPGRLLVTADDFGWSPAVNAAVGQASADGILTGASLMVTGEAAGEAVALARGRPALAVGLHLALSGAFPALPPGRIPHLVGRDGRLEPDPVRAGLRYGTSAAARRELEAEIEAQFARFAATGLALSHVDGHHHLHLHPAAFPLVAELARRHGALGVRLPWEGLAALSEARPRRAALEALALGALARRWRPLARRHGLAFAPRVHGIVRSGCMDAPYLTRLIDRLESRVTEIFLHPSTDPGRARGPNPGDLAALVAPAVRSAIAARGLVLGTYADLEADA
ncbi:MAG TPA: hopanoid biosynthesis-associated protein HpnK [Anaeromyxobacter sp.]|nr:hopanoid biosynthesis-associated protein HpnK [Anaeromyxobacter sp.]